MYALKGRVDGADGMDPSHTASKGFYFTNGGTAEVTFP